MKESLPKKYTTEHQVNRTRDDNPLFYTFDLGLATALISVGFELVSLNKENPRKAQFIIRQEQNLDSAISNYWSGELVVKARTFFETQKMLKNRIYSE
jgi:hypothetical protein